jgi:hypothetical protein
MNLTRTRPLFAAILLCLSTAALSGTGPAPTGNVPHRGSASATSYSNDFFNLRVEFPAGWTAMTDDELAGMPDEFIGGPIRSLRSGLPLASLMHFPLAMLINTETGRETQTFANVIVVAKSLQGQTAAAMPMVAAMVRDGVRANPGVKTVSPIYTEVLAGKTFRRFDTQGSTGLHEVRQHWYLTESRGYALIIMTTGSTAAEEAAIAALLNNFTFTPGAGIAKR